MKNRLREMLEEDEGEEPCVHFVPILDQDGNSYGIIGLDTLQEWIFLFNFYSIKIDLTLSLSEGTREAILVSGIFLVKFFSTKSYKMSPTSTLG